MNKTIRHPYPVPKCAEDLRETFSGNRGEHFLACLR
jgi:hypothetical protein